MRVLTIKSNGSVWHVPLEIIAKRRAAYYAKKDSDNGDGDYADIYAEELDHAMNDSYDAIDWYCGNMDWDDVKEQAKLVETPKAEPNNRDAEYDIEDID